MILSIEGMFKFLLILFLLFTQQTFSQIDELKRRTKTLCSPDFHGRGYVNKGDSIAAEFLKTEFQNIGVKPYYESYFQSFNLDVNTFPNEMEIYYEGKLLKPGIDFLINPNSSGRVGKLKLYEIGVNDALIVDSLKSFIQNLFSINHIEDPAVLFDMTLVSSDTVKLLRQVASKLAMFIPVVEIVNDKFTWSVGLDELFLPYIQIQENCINNDGVLSLNIYSEMHINYECRNVIGYIPSKKNNAKTIIFTAHYDHLGKMGNDTYFPGANDNASGTAMIFSLAEYFKENPSNFNIMFVAFAGEEAGLVGSKYFVENSILDLKNIRFVINLDIMGSGEDGITIVNGSLFDKEFSIMNQINKSELLVKEIKKRGPSANSDHYWFSQKGVPAFFIYTRGPNKHYHDIFDTYDSLSFAESIDIIRLLIQFVNQL
ncbi:MAG: aminopeptidase [Crocinitomicaceae bacterium]|nr:aminopeptidase [Crocinitomicaceae bacterium]MBB79046.1 aminopeptidase [Crocinitomicaceae bacterium]